MPSINSARYAQRVIQTESHESPSFLRKVHRLDPPLRHSWYVQYLVGNSYFRPAQSSKPFDTSAHWLEPVGNWENILYAEFPSSCDLHLHGGGKCTRRDFLIYSPEDSACLCIATSCRALQKIRRTFYNNSATENGVTARAFIFCSDFSARATYASQIT